MPRAEAGQSRNQGPKSKISPKIGTRTQNSTKSRGTGLPTAGKSHKKLKRSGDALFSGVLWGFPPCFMRRFQKKYPRGTARPARGTPGRLSIFFKNVYIFTKGIPPGLSEIQTPRQPIFDQLWCFLCFLLNSYRSLPRAPPQPGPHKTQGCRTPGLGARPFVAFLWGVRF